MTLWIISFTLRGAHLAARLAGRLPEARAFTMARYAAGTGTEPVEELALWCRTAWEQAQGLIFVGAAGIAVRSVAPLLRKKTTDPAVVVIDEAGRFAVSLVSGHVGGANELARQVAQCLDAVAVVTTATDVNQKFAVDVFAEKNRMVIHSMAKAKEISAAVLAGHPVGLHTRLPLCGSLPPELTPGRVQRENIEIGYCAQYADSLLLIPGAFIWESVAGGGPARRKLPRRWNRRFLPEGFPVRLGGSGQHRLKNGRIGSSGVGPGSSSPCLFILPKRFRRRPDAFRVPNLSKR